MLQEPKKKKSKIDHQWLKKEEHTWQLRRLRLRVIALLLLLLAQRLSTLLLPSSRRRPKTCPARKRRRPKTSPAWWQIALPRRHIDKPGPTPPHQGITDAPAARLLPAQPLHTPSGYRFLHGAGESTRELVARCALPTVELYPWTTGGEKSPRRSCLQTRRCEARRKGGDVGNLPEAGLDRKWGGGAEPL
jgi:hypothetical protein